jgi:hypothetical protein
VSLGAEQRGQQLLLLVGEVLLDLRGERVQFAAEPLGLGLCSEKFFEPCDRLRDHRVLLADPLDGRAELSAAAAGGSAATTVARAAPVSARCLRRMRNRAARALVEAGHRSHRHAPALHAASATILDAPDAAQIFDLVEAGRADSLFAPPTVWIGLANHPDFAARDLGTLRKAYYGASIMPVPVPVLERLRARLPGLGSTTAGEDQLARLPVRQHLAGERIDDLGVEVVLLVGYGRTNHAGRGDDVLAAVIAEKPLPPDNEANTDGNRYFYGFECENLGDGEDPWPAAQLEAIEKAAAALCRAHGWNARSVIGLLEWQPGKIDPRGFAMSSMRARVEERLNHEPGWDRSEETGVSAADDLKKLIQTDGVINSPRDAADWATNKHWAWQTHIQDNTTRIRQT